jgi:hypothetical protein
LSEFSDKDDSVKLIFETFRALDSDLIGFAAAVLLKQSLENTCDSIFSFDSAFSLEITGLAFDALQLLFSFLTFFLFTDSIRPIPRSRLCDSALVSILFSWSSQRSISEAEITAKYDFLCEPRPICVRYFGLLLAGARLSSRFLLSIDPAELPRVSGPFESVMQCYAALAKRAFPNFRTVRQL